MSMVKCDEVTKGLRDTEAFVTIKDKDGTRHVLRLEEDFLTFEGGHKFLPVGVVQVNRKDGTVLVEFPQEPETGISRIWVKDSQLDESQIEAFA